MKQSTITLHVALIRAVKAAVAAWERWLKEQEQQSNDSQ